jgi:hypothetical protein
VYNRFCFDSELFNIHAGYRAKWHKKNVPTLPIQHPLKKVRVVITISLQPCPKGATV